MTALIPVRTVAEILGVHRATVYRMAARGDLPRPLRIAGLTRWKREDIEALIEDAAREDSEAA